MASNLKRRYQTLVSYVESNSETNMKTEFALSGTLQSVSGATKPLQQAERGGDSGKLLQYLHPYAGLCQ